MKNDGDGSCVAIPIYNTYITYIYMTNNRSSLGFPNYGQQFIEVQPHRMQQKFPFLVGPVGHTFGVSA